MERNPNPQEAREFAYADMDETPLALLDDFDLEDDRELAEEEDFHQVVRLYVYEDRD